MAVALSWAVSHAEGRVTRSIRSAFTAAVFEFATHTRVLMVNASKATRRRGVRLREGFFFCIDTDLTDVAASLVHSTGWHVG